MSDIEISLGDVFLDTDPRSEGRKVTVTGYDHDLLTQESFVWVRSDKGRSSRINVKRLRPTRGKRGYRRVAHKEARE